MESITSNTKLVAHCGLYCGACRSYIKGKCPGCIDNAKATWCKVRSCCRQNGYASCADCKTHSNPMECKFFNNFIARMFGLIFRSDRNACIAMIKEKGYQSFAEYMAGNGWQTIRKVKR